MRVSVLRRTGLFLACVFVLTLLVLQPMGIALAAEAENAPVLVEEQCTETITVWDNGDGTHTAKIRISDDDINPTENTGEPERLEDSGAGGYGLENTGEATQTLVNGDLARGEAVAAIAKEDKQIKMIPVIPEELALDPDGIAAEAAQARQEGPQAPVEPPVPAGTPAAPADEQPTAQPETPSTPAAPADGQPTAQPEAPPAPAEPAAPADEPPAPAEQPAQPEPDPVTEPAPAADGSTGNAALQSLTEEPAAPAEEPSAAVEEPAVEEPAPAPAGPSDEQAAETPEQITETPETAEEPAPATPEAGPVQEPETSAEPTVEEVIKEALAEDPQTGPAAETIATDAPANGAQPTGQQETAAAPTVETTTEKIGFDGSTYEGVKYENVFAEGMGIELRPFVNGVKEDVVIEKYVGVFRYAYILKLTGMTPELIDNEIILKDKDGVEAARIPAPFMTDAAGEESRAISVLLEETNVYGEYKLTYTLSQSWLEDESRVYPVTVDPSFYYDSHVNPNPAFEDNIAVNNMLNSVNNPSATKYWIGMHNNVESRAFIRVALPDEMNGCTVLNFTWYMYIWTGGGDGHDYRIVPCTMEWHAGEIMWGEGVNFHKAWDANYEVYRKGLGAGGMSGGWNAIDITKVASAWFNPWGKRQIMAS